MCLKKDAIVVENIKKPERQKCVPFLLILQSVFPEQIILPEEWIRKENPVVMSVKLHQEFPDLFREGKSGQYPCPGETVKKILENLDRTLQHNAVVDYERIYLLAGSGCAGLAWEVLRRRSGFFSACLFIKDHPEKSLSLPEQPSSPLPCRTCVPEELHSSLQWLFSCRLQFFTSMALPEKYNVITLDSCGFTAKILPEAGGNLFSLRHKESATPLLREPHSENELFHAPERFGIPLLFPPNRIEDGSFLFEGKRYSLPVNQMPQKVHLHGVAVNKSWDLIGHGKEFALLRFVFNKNAPEYPSFPFDCEILRRFELKEYGLCETVRIRNTGENNMPLGLGFHTAFPADETTSARLGGAQQEIEIGKQRFLPTGRTLPWKELDPREEWNPIREAVSFHTDAGLLKRGSKEFHGAELHYATGTLRYVTDEKFQFWYIWNGGGMNNFICLEPVSWMANALNMKLPPALSGVRTLLPGEEITFVNKIEFFPGTVSEKRFPAT